MGKGNITLETDKASITLYDVLYVPDMGANLLSMAKATDHGHNLVFTPTGCQIGGTRAWIDRVREGNIYLLRAKRFTLATLWNRDTPVSPELWHRHLGHHDFGKLGQGVIGKAVVGLDVHSGNRMAISEIVERVCDTGAGERQHGETMTGTREKTKDLLKCVHSDICRAMQTTTLSGERYFVTVTDVTGRTDRGTRQTCKRGQEQD